MNRKLLAAAAAVLATLAAPAVNAESFASVNARAFEAAERGADALRSFVNRTRMVHALSYADYAGAIPNPDVAGFGAETAGYDLAPAAEADPAAGQRAADELREQILRDLAHE